ncbi:hypothetical protein HJFPF1_00221 [Paramyrothecium foliicola]|nr:hypothetical protein HJFPF1_00221 [Paramyrothecium foliicola]
MTSRYTSDSLKIVGEADLLSKIERGERERKTFEEHYERQARVLEAHVDTAIQLFEHEANGLKARFIQHVPISWRIKDIESAIGSLRRRQNDRQRRALLKKRYEGLQTGSTWERYWSRQGKPYLIKDVDSFPNYESMFEALHDIGGLRVCVYFPEDIKRVIEFIKEHPDIEDDPIVANWGPGASPDDDLETYLDNLEGADSEKQEDVSMPPQAEPRPFGGYRATHVRLKVKASAVDWNRTSYLPSQRPKGDFVEQDLIYKPKQGPASQGLRNILDIFNGIVAMGETSLKQLALIQAEERERSAEAKNALAEDRDILSSWIWKACREVSPSIQDPRTRASPVTRTWSHLGKLLLVLRSSQNHSYGAISRLVKSAITRKEGQPITCEFSLDIMAALAREAETPKTTETAEPAPVEADISSQRKSSLGDVNGANFREDLREEVLYIVEVLKMAIFLGLEAEFVPCARRAICRQNDQNDRTPSLLDMLDFLHPDKPTLCNEHFLDMKLFCARFRSMDFQAVAESKQQLCMAELPKALVDSGYSARPKLQNSSFSATETRQLDVVPRELCAFLDDADNVHWIPEILVMANSWNWNGNRRLNLSPLRRTHYSFSSLNLSTNSVLGPPSTNQDVAYDLLRGSSRFNLGPDDGGGETAMLTIDRQTVPLTLAQTDGVPALHVDKNAPRPRPHPGYFMAVTTAGAGPRADVDTPTHGWIYSQSRAESWSIRWREKPSANTAEVSMKHPQDSVFLGFAKRLNAAYGSVKQVGDTYIITNQDAKFTLLSTADEFILRKGDYSRDNLTTTPIERV